MKRILPSLLALSLLAGCGVANAPIASRAAAGGVSTLSKAVTQKAMRAVFKYHFTKADADKNGYLSPAEVPLYPAVQGLETIQPDQARKIALERYDLNKDNKVSLREFSRPELFQPELVLFRQAFAKAFTTGDKDANRALSAEEFTAMQQPFAFEAADRNKNGKLTLSEFEDAAATYFAASLVPGEPAPQPAPAEPVPAEPTPAEPDPANSDQSYDPADTPGDEPTDS